MDLNQLSGAQRKVLRQAVVAAFTFQSLEMLLADHLDKSLAALVVPDAIATMVFELIKRMQEEGWTDEFVRAVQAERPNNPLVRNLTSSLSLIDVEGDKSLTSKFLVKDSLERTVKERAGIANFVAWADDLADLRRKICRIEDPQVPGKALGTGFLVYRDLVLTNYHVVEKHISGARDPANLSCRFDYAIESSGENAGTAEPLAAGPGWLVAYTPYSTVDTGDRGGLPGPNELDYALLKLAEPVGDVPGPDGDKRGWIKVSTLPPLPEPTDIVFIVQHPKGEPLKVAVGAIIKRNANDSRVRYDTNTERGSSGSPCFDAKLHLIALHHGGDPDTGRLAEFNQGIPIDKIVAHLATRPDVPRFWQ